MTQRQSNKIPQTCHSCGNIFYQYPSKANRGKRVYCSRKCMIIPIEEKFWRHVHKTDTCWLWTGRLHRLGYGIITHSSKQQFAHRVGYELLVGPIPEGMELDHVWDRGCRNRHCVNPDHLEPVTHAENMSRGERTRRVQCPHGHSPDRYKRLPNGHRYCRDCRNIEQQKRRAQLRGRK